MIAALTLLKQAQSDGMQITISYDGIVDYRGASAIAAWNAVKATTEAHAIFHDASGNRIGWAYLMAPGPNTCEPDESIVDCSGAGKISDMVDAII